MEYLTIGALALGYLALFIILNKFIKNKKYLYFAIAAIIFGQMAFRVHLADHFWNVYNGVLLNAGSDSVNYVKNPDFRASFSRWALNFCVVMFPLALISKNNVFKQVATFIGLPAIIFVISTFSSYMYYYELGNTFGYDFSLATRKIILILELALLLAAGVFILITNKNRFKNLKLSVIFAPFFILITVPVNIPQTLIGYGSVRFTFFSGIGILSYSLMIILIYILFKRFKDKDIDMKWSIVYFLTYLMLVQYTFTNRKAIDLYSLPLQLCNIGVYLTMIAIIFKWQKLFDMLIIVNLQGTVIALLVVNTVEKTGVFSFWQLHYLYEHILLFMVPILACTLGLFKMPNKQSLKNAFIGFSIYYYFCVLLGTYINKLDPLGLKTVDYFYLFDGLIIDLLPISKYFRDLAAWRLGKYTIYPLFFLIVHLGYSAFLLLTYRALYYYQRLYFEHQEINKLRKQLWRKKQC